MQPNHIGDVSFWYADIGLPKTLRPNLTENTQADVAIVGAGFTGLWTAYYLKKTNPALNVLVIEKEFAGFGASGRNGGWCMGTFAWNHAAYARATSRSAVLEMVRELETTVPEITRVCAEQGIDADIIASEELMLATNPAQLARMRAVWDFLRVTVEAERSALLPAISFAETLSRMPNVGLDSDFERCREVGGKGPAPVFD